jgi:hypothetical protein
MHYLLVANLITRQKDQRLNGERYSPAERAATDAAPTYLRDGVARRIDSRGSGRGIAPTQA